MTITKFRDEHRWLSNFWMTPADYDGVRYPSSEHAYQAAKTLELSEREYIRGLETPGMSKTAGQDLDLRPDWDSVKYSVMEEITRSKYELDTELRDKLLATKGQDIIEGNHWCDVYWGVCFCPFHDGLVGENNLGKILMALREELSQA